jgi:hypothetical protein
LKHQFFEGDSIMAKRYVYKNVNNRPINIGGYQFTEGRELESDILINGFNEAVSNGFLKLVEREPETPEPDATQAPQTGGTGKVKVIFHTGGNNANNKNAPQEAEFYPNAPVSFPDIDALPGFAGWFKDAEFTKPVNLDKAKAPKEGDLHFYAKFEILKPEDTVNPNPNAALNTGEGEGSLPEQGASSVANESAGGGGNSEGKGSKNK